MSAFEGEHALPPQSAALFEEFRSAVADPGFTADSLLAEEARRYDEAFEYVRAQLTFFRDQCSTTYYDRSWHSVHEVPGENRQVVWICGKARNTYIAINNEVEDGITRESQLYYAEYVFSNNLYLYAKQEGVAYKDMADDWNPTTKLQEAALIQVFEGKAHLFRGNANRNVGLFEPVNPLRFMLADGERLSEADVLARRHETIKELRVVGDQLGKLSSKTYYSEGVVGFYI